MNETQTTAYALNEMHGIERDSFESDLAADMKLQRELQSTSKVADALEQVMTEPGEGLEPQAREKLILAMAANQKTFRARRKIVRFVVPVSLAAAASIAVLLLVTGGKTKQEPAMAAAGGGAQTMSLEKNAAGSFSATISGDKGVFTFSGSGALSNPDAEPAADSFRVKGSRIVSLSDSARTRQAQAEAEMPAAPAVRERPLLWDERLQRIGSTSQDAP